MTSSLILTSHLRRKAVIYIRQSTAHQVLTNQESQRMQRDMKDHALRLGWPESLIEIVEADTGNTAKTTAGRAGYKNLLSELALGQVGIVLSYESTRLSRNCSDWYPLLDLCSLHHCLIGDRDGVYDPSTANGRLFLGMKGIVSELELHTLQGRLTVGIDNKAKRGELVQRLPVGYIHLDDGTIVKDPDLQVQETVALVFSSFLALRSSSKVVKHLREHGLLLPARSQTEPRVRFEAPSAGPVLRMLRTPTYAGAYVFGRTRWMPRTDPKRPGNQSKLLPPDQWRVVIKDHFAGYVDWDTFQRIQSILANNYAHHRRRQSQGVARNGCALLAGLCYCGHCGHQMTLSYGSSAYYRCRCVHQDGEPTPRSESIRMSLVDPCVQQSFFEALAPVELDLYEAAYRRTQDQHQEVCAAQERQLQRLRYEVNRARRQYDLADPENRLVTQELERRWESALRALQEAEQRYEQDQRQMRTDAQRRIPLELRTQFASVGQALPGRA
jgi:DNA invertase Pin-like site-specific DNA recombinase